MSTSDEYRYRRFRVERWYKALYALMRLNASGTTPEEAVSMALLNPARTMILDVLKAVFNGIEQSADAKWTLSHPYAVNTIVAPAGTRNGYLYRTTGGTSAASEPTWPTDVGETVTDNGMTWTCFARDAIGEFDDAFTAVKQRLARQIVAPAAKWAATRQYDEVPASTPPPYGAPVVPTTANGHRYVVVTPGTSAGSAPTWPTNGTTVTDGTVVWQDAGAYWTATTKVAEGEITNAYNAGLFECTTAGTTGASEPTWGAIDLTDGTVHWKRIETPAGTSNINLSANIGAQLKPLFAEALALAGASSNFDSAGIETDGCWQDFGGDRFAYTGQEDPPYMPIFPGHYYHASRLTADSEGRPVIHSTQEWGFDPKFSCPELLEIGDELVITVEGVAGGSAGYQVGDTVQAEVTRVGPTEFGGGQTGDDTLTWNVAGTVDSFAPYALVTTAIADYSDSGLVFRIAPGGVAFALGDVYEFDVEGPRIRWRKDGGGWSSQIDLTATIALADGLSADFAPGSAPSWVVDDQWAFSAESVNGPEGLRQPTDERCTWTGSTTITVTPAVPGAVTAVMLADHTIPSDAVIHLQGSNDNFSTTPLDQAITWAARHIYLKGVFGTYAKYRVTVDKGGSLSWLWLGDPFVPTIETGAAELGKLTKTWRLPSLTARRALGVKVVHEALPQDTIDDLLDMLEHACTYDDRLFAVVPNPEEGEVGLVRYKDDTLELTDVKNYQPRDTVFRLQTATLTLEPAP